RGRSPRPGGSRRSRGSRWAAHASGWDGLARLWERDCAAKVAARARFGTPRTDGGRVSDRPWAGRRLHLIGLGGAGMSGYARVATQLGARVSGSDPTDSPALPAPRASGV